MEHLLTSYGYLAIALLAFVQACCVPIPSEVTFGFAGVLAGEGRLNLVLIVLVGTACELVGSLVAYGVGRLGGRAVVERLGRFVLITPAELDRAEHWLVGRRAFAVAIGRAMPFIRAFTSVAAGTGGMPVRRFVLFSAIGTFVYVVALASIGYGVGSAWHQVVRDFSVAGYVVVAIVAVAIVVFVARRLRTLREQRAAATRASVSLEEP